MTDPNIQTLPGPSDDPDHPSNLIIGQGTCVNLPNHSVFEIVMRMPLPGIVIFVHGVNSDGEWYRQAEEGLCKGLNTRMRRDDHQLVHTGTAAGQLTPANYMDELTSDGFINPFLTAKTFIQTDDTFTPVIHFRWGYKASAKDLQDFGSGLYLNENDYWGGGPFANGCSSLADLWSNGLNDDLFLFFHVEHINPDPSRNVYSCPPRPYFVLHALRLAKLIESIRQKQADVPITIVCHSQGTMVSMAAAFLGDEMADVADPCGKIGRCVADTYVLCNSPYSLAKSNFTENWADRDMADSEGHTGRPNLQSREQTFAAFLDIIRGQAKYEQSTKAIDDHMANERFDFTAESDRSRHGLNGHTLGRVTLYCNPHDQVISSSAIEGIGWRGMSEDEIKATRGDGVFTQRLFAQGWPVGNADEKYKTYDYWADQYNLKPGGENEGSMHFWHPPPLNARYSLTRGIEANQNWVGKVFTVLGSVFIAPAVWVAKIPINESPPVEDNAGRPKSWAIPLNAPPLASPFLPQAMNFDGPSLNFDQDYDAPGRNRNAKVKRTADDPYSQITYSEDDKSRSDAPQGNAASEAQQMYEDRAYVRMQAKRAGIVKKDEHVNQEDEGGTASQEYKEWRAGEIKTHMAENIDTHATDHSTILTNPMHSECALAYDVAVGRCDIFEKDLHRLRIVADWRLLEDTQKDNPHNKFFEYFKNGKFLGDSVDIWAGNKINGGYRPRKILASRGSGGASTSQPKQGDM